MAPTHFFQKFVGDSDYREYSIVLMIKSTHKHQDDVDGRHAGF